MDARAVVCTAANAVELRRVGVRDPQAGEVLIETQFSTISPGTELRCLKGKQEGTRFPFIMGYASVGRVVAAGAGAEPRIGETVFYQGTTHADGATITWGGHCSHAVLPAAQAFTVPEGVDPLEATLAKLGAISYHGMRLSRPAPNERVAVVGLGAIGQMSALMHRLAGAHVVACDRAPGRVAAARALGIDAREAPGEPAEVFARAFPQGVDIVVDATGVAAAMPSIIAVARELPWGVDDIRGARYLVQGSYADGFTVPYQPAFSRELTFLVPRSTVPGDEQAVLAFLGRRQLSLRAMIGEARDPAQAAQAFADLDQRDPRWTTLAFRWK